MDRNDALKQIPIFGNISAESLKVLADGAEFKDYLPGEPVIQFGEEGRFFSAIVSGEVEISRAGESGERERLNVLSAGEYFGEMSLMTGEPTAADVIAIKPTLLLQISHHIMTLVIAREPKLTAALAKTISKRYMMLAGNKLEQEHQSAARKAQNDPYGLKSFPLPSGGKILTINAGSSSLKYRLFDGARSDDIFKGLIERIGMTGTRHIFERNGDKIEVPVGGNDYAAAFESMINALGGGQAIKGINVVGHRVVHGANKFSASAVIDKDVIAGIRECCKFAPLHNPANLAAIEEAMRRIPNAPHVAVFDTGFHKTIPRYAKVYGVPYRFYEADGIRRYGFHGMSHNYVALAAATFLKSRFSRMKIITCHLGNGASLAAVDHGRSIDTSMGMTPLEGLLMGTRSGDFDSGALLHIMKERNLSAAEMEKILLKESGLLGISGVSSDMREILDAAGNGSERALLAVQAFCYRIKKYIGAYWAALGGLDALVFTGGIGERSAEIRARVCQGLSGIGIILDEEANRSPELNGRDAALVSTQESPVKVLVVPTDEERMIAIETGKAVTHEAANKIIRTAGNPMPIGVSAHHAHLCREHVESLFGTGHKLTVHSPLAQPGQFACKEQVNLVGPKGIVERVRVLGPERNESQVEISRTEEFKLGIDAPIRLSGDLEGSPGITITGPTGSVALPKGVICARRHIHMNPEDALGYGIRDRDVVMVTVEGERSLIFGDVVVRVNPEFKLEFHLDTDEANAAQVSSGMVARLHSIQSRR
jgi:acetate kinase